MHFIGYYVYFIDILNLLSQNSYFIETLVIFEVFKD